MMRPGLAGIKRASRSALYGAAAGLAGARIDQAMTRAASVHEATLFAASSSAVRAGYPPMPISARSRTIASKR